MEISPLLLELLPKMNGIWKFYSELFGGKGNKILDNSLDQLASKNCIEKSDLKKFLETFNEDNLTEDELRIVNDFLSILYANMFEDLAIRPKLVGNHIISVELSLNEIKELIVSKQNSTTSSKTRISKYIFLAGAEVGSRMTLFGTVSKASEKRIFRDLLSRLIDQIEEPAP